MIVLEGLILVVTVVLVARVLVRRPIRVEARAHPALALATIAVGVAALVVAGWVASRWDVARHTIVVVLALASIAALWRAAPTFGSRRGLPPGSLGLGTSLDAIGDPTFYRRAVQRWGRVFKMSQVHQPVVCIADLGVAQALFSAHAADLGQSEWSFNRLVPDGYLEYMRGDAHGKYRNALSGAFAGADFASGRDVISGASRAQLTALVEASRHGGVDPESFLLPAAMATLLRGILGVPPNHGRFASLVSLFTDLIRPMELYLPVPVRTRNTYDALGAEVRSLGDAVRAAPGATMPSVLSALLAREAAALDDDTIVGNLILMGKEGSIMVRGLLRWLLKMLCDHPEWSARFRAIAHDQDACAALARCFVLETLRLHESRYVYRTALRDLQVGPYRIPRGWLVRVCVGEAHERDDHFHEPQAFSPDRFTSRPLASERFAPFGQGAHACLGEDLTLEVAQAFVQEAALQFDVRTVADGPPWRINRHWGLWRPSQAWRVVATPVTAADAPNAGLGVVTE